MEDQKLPKSGRSSALSEELAGLAYSSERLQTLYLQIKKTDITHQFSTISWFGEMRHAVHVRMINNLIAIHLNKALVIIQTDLIFRLPPS